MMQRIKRRKKVMLMNDRLRISSTSKVVIHCILVEETRQRIQRRLHLQLKLTKISIMTKSKIVRAVMNQIRKNLL
jgi:hypothetical protein